MGHEQLFFVDDNPVEREEVGSSLPHVPVFDENLHLLRTRLLTESSFESPKYTDESKVRTDMLKAQIKREELRDEIVDEETFLKTLGIKVDLIRTKSEKYLDRIVELVQRTNQFNTSLIRHTSSEISQFLKDDEVHVYVMKAEDKFTPYGVVGVCILKENRVENFIMSCRVIGLKVAVPFLISALQDAKIEPLVGEVVEGPRNHPSRSIFGDAGFSKQKELTFELKSWENLMSIDPEIYKISIERDE